MQSRQYVLRIEGVNLGNVIDDTDQLSVRRGGGLMILNAATQLLELLPADVRSKFQVVPISTGASIGLFEFEATSDSDAKNVQKAVEDAIKVGKLPYTSFDGTEKFLPLQHGTFVVDIAEVDSRNRVQQAEQLATAKNRWQQLQQPTMSLDGVWREGTEPCVLDRTRVASPERRDLNQEMKNQPVCDSTYDRWHYGRGARQKFYDQELAQPAVEDSAFGPILANAKFTNELSEISGIPARSATGERALFPVPKNLIDKLAVFYVDGNGFGEKGRRLFRDKGAEGFQKWSDSLRNHHRNLLKSLIVRADLDSLWQNNGLIRLETLLWGGDEIVWVVPAWKGWELAKWFFDHNHEIEVLGEKIPLTYGCGLVFSHTKAPIKNIVRLAQDLGDISKQALPGENAIAYEVLESFDDISGDLEAHRAKFLPKKRLDDQDGLAAADDLRRLVIRASSLSANWQALNTIGKSREFPMRQLYLLTKAWRTQASVPNKAFDAATERVKAGALAALSTSTVAEGGDEQTRVDDRLGQLLKDLGDPHGWLHLLQMSPYLPAESIGPIEVQP